MAGINDGGPAFPSLEPFEQFDEDRGQYVTTHQPCGGMKLRDYFAAHVMSGLCACPNVHGSRDALALDAYKFADAMLKARDTK